MPFGPLRVPHIPRLSGVNTVTGSSNNAPTAGTGMRPSLRRKGKNRLAHAPLTIPDYGSTTTGSGAATPQRLEGVREDPESFRGTPSSEIVESEGDGLLEEDEDEELDPASYRKTVRCFILIPLISFLLFILLLFLPRLIWHSTSSTPTNTRRYIHAFVTSAALWSLSHLLRVPLYKFIAQIISSLLSCLRLSSNQEIVISSVKFLHTVLFITFQELLRVSAFSILDLRLYGTSFAPPDTATSYAAEIHPVNDPSFLEAWLLGLGWAAAEVCASIAQGYDLLSTYEDLFASSHDTVDLETSNGINLADQYRDEEEEDSLAGTGTGNGVVLVMNGTNPRAKPGVGSDDVVDDADLDLDVAVTRLLNAKARDDLEAVYGVPFVDIPVFIHILHDVDSFLLSIGLTLMLSSAYISSYTSPSSSPPLMQVLHFWPTFIVATAVHVFLGVLHTPPVLPWIGVPAASYIACLLGLGVFFAGIGFWGGLW